VRNLTESYEGLQLALTINPGLALAWRDANGISRYDKLIQAFKQLNQVLTPGADRFSLFINPDYEKTGFTDLDSLLIALADYPENMRNMEPNLTSLQYALDALSSDESGQDKTLLYITVLPYPQDALQLDGLLQTALDHHISINIWLAGDPEISHLPASATFTGLSRGQWGQLVSFLRL